MIAPLIALDELPSWFQVYCNLGIAMVMGLQPVSLTYIPRDGEYDVICHNCSPGAHLNHTSRSERGSDSPRSIDAQSKPCTGGFIPPISNALQIGSGTKVPLAEPFPLYNLATLNANILGTSSAFTKARVLPTQSSSASEPLPELSPDSSKSSQSDVKASVAASLAGVARRASIGQLDREPTPFDSLIRSPAEIDAIAVAIAASLCGQSPTESLASEISLTAAVEFLKQRKGITALSQGTSLCQKGSLKIDTSSKGNWSLRSPRKINIPASKRQVKVGHHRTGKAKKRKPKSPNHSVPAQGRQEQLNSETKRRARREKMKHSRESSSHGHYHDMTRITHGQSGVPHR
jgi:hypothetical protein